MCVLSIDIDIDSLMKSVENWYQIDIDIVIDIDINIDIIIVRTTREFIMTLALSLTGCAKTKIQNL